MSRTKRNRSRDEIFQSIQRNTVRSYSITATWPNGRINQMHRKDKAHVREMAEDLEMKGVHVKVVEWTGSQFRQLADLHAFAKRTALPAAATYADKVAAVKADLEVLARQAAGRRALR
ncbi:hypothetical protein NLX86_18995 [Streptomyces sp. A3M-1-3]|uniref:hypothetical protein n=1 Tax=Streptomyces sp. A3M-1-3 TaxID=2962044 RepID=UPI0020B65846|nr:hypothetical protein [Streptomyces sp. A3M-1-3]MCP3820106.1 hypothetical protein [Streptomyces sp. A3M-1-3]